MAPAKKYKLFSSAVETETGKKPICAFLNSPGGCKNGNKCRFLHTTTNVEDATAEEGGKGSTNNSNSNVQTSNSSVISSESEGEITEEVTAAPTPTQSNDKSQQGSNNKNNKSDTPSNATSTEKNNKKKKKRKRKTPDSDEDIFASKTKAAPAADSDEDIFGAPVDRNNNKNSNNNNKQTPDKNNSNNNKKEEQQQQQQSVPPPDNNTPSNKKQKKTVKVKVEEVEEETPSILPTLAIKLPIAPFVPPQTKITAKTTETPSKAESSATPATTPKGKASSSNSSDGGDNEKTTSNHKNKIKKQKYVVPTSTAIGRKWKKVVEKTRENSKFDELYDFTTNKKNDEENGSGTWIQAKPYGEWCKDLPQIIAIDCEMVLTEDPVTGAKDNSLCRISIVNGENSEEVLLDTLVKPVWPVIDYRTRIHGITEENLENVKFTLRHAQAFLLALCSDETIIAGHAVHNDLAALRMEHHTVVDSAFLYKAKDSEFATVSLRDLAKNILKKSMPDYHDSVNDARLAFNVLEHYLNMNGNVVDIERSNAAEGQAAAKAYACQLFVHRIPEICKKSHISTLFLEHASIKPEEINDIEFNEKKSGKTIVTFRTGRHASLAFDSLKGNPEKDASGRLQKKIYLKNGNHIKVRKMAFEREERS